MAKKIKIKQNNAKQYANTQICKYANTQNNLNKIT